MSGIVGLFHRGGAPVDGGLVQAMTRFLGFRGPDGFDTWWDGPVGFGHAMLRTTHDCPSESQPRALESRYWTTADARLDRRVELTTELRDKGRPIRGPIPDSELILQAYASWGEDCVEHLYGDFAFAIWDAWERTLFCAHDHFGIKPFYYAEIGELLLFSNTLNCLRAHPEISDGLNEAAIADFLLFGLNCDNSTTTFRQVRRLPPAHALSASAEGVRLTRYWSAPTEGRIRYSRADDYVEHFRFLLRAAVADRLRTDRVGILLSGGLDSSSVAALARELTGDSGVATELLAYTTIHDSLVPDPDRIHACQVAESLRIPIHYVAVDHLRPFQCWDDPDVSWPEPVDDPFLAGLFEQFGRIAADCRVALSGEGSDNLMYFQLWPYVKDLLRTGNWKRAAAVVPLYLRQRSSFLPGIRRRVQELFRKEPAVPEIPRWFAVDFARRVDLEARFKEWSDLPAVSPPHPILPDAHASLSLPQWTQMFEHENSGVTHCPVEVYYPYLDLRIVNYLLALPPLPWFYKKTLLREAMNGSLPENVRLRSKTPLMDDPFQKQLEVGGWDWLNQVSWCEELSRYVDLASLPPLNRERNASKIELLIRLICLNFWLRSTGRVRYNFHAEACHG
jgi:asparagine synthase (glutamine-hydrolysing)